MAEQLSLFGDKENIKEDYQLEDMENIDVKYGDIFEVDGHRIMCGDSTKEEDVKKLMNHKTANMLFTDPPYSYNYQSNARKNKFDILLNDNVMLDFLKPSYKYINGFVFIFTSWKVLDKWIEYFKKYYELTNIIIWDKGGMGMGDLEKTFATDYEIALVSHNGKLLNNRIGSVWKIYKDGGNQYLHPTQKPIELCVKAIKISSKKNDIILDLFGGSGSTLIGAQLTNRKAYIMELDIKYVQLILNRYKKVFGKQWIKVCE